MKTRFPIHWILAVCFAAGSALGQSPVLVQGQPPLTEETVGRFTEFFEWAFDVQLTVEQRQVLRKYAFDAWSQKKKSDMKTSSKWFSNRSNCPNWTRKSAP